MDYYKLLTNRNMFVDNMMNLLSQLGLRDIRCCIIIDEGVSDSSEIASTALSGIKCDENLEDVNPLKFNILYKPSIMIHTKVLDNFIDDLCGCLSSTNDKVNELLKIICLENSLAHEIKHLQQFTTLQLKEDDVDIIKDDTAKTFGFVLSQETVFALEKDANDFMLSKNEESNISDLKLKKYFTDLMYNNAMAHATEKLNEGIESPEYSEIIKKYKDGVKEHFEKLNSHIQTHYVG